MTYQQKFMKKVSSSNTSKPNTPDIEIKNPIKKDIFVNAIDLTPNEDFTEKGKVMVFINDVLIFSTADETGDNPFEDYGLVSVPLHKQTFRRARKIEIFIWNSVDSTEIKLAAEIIIGETDENLSQGSQSNPKQKIKLINLTQEVIVAIGGSETLYTVPTGKVAETSQLTARISDYAGSTDVRVRYNGIKVINFNSTLHPVGTQLKGVQGIGLEAGQTILVTRTPAGSGTANVDVGLSVKESVAS